MDRFCCLRLNVFGILIGVFGAAVSLISIIVLIIGLNDINHLTEVTYEKIHDPDILMENVRRGILVTVTLYLIINILNVIASLLLIVGTLQIQHLMLIPWLINAGISSICSALYFMSAIFYEANGTGQFITTFSAGVNFAIQGLLWYIVYSLYNVLKKPFEFIELELKKNKEINVCSTPFEA